MSEPDLDDLSIYEMFRMEAEDQVTLMGECLLVLQEDASNADAVRTIMRGAHSFKGAARIVGLTGAVRLAHALEDRFVAAGAGRAIEKQELNLLFAAVDLLRGLSSESEEQATGWLTAHQPDIDTLVQAIGTGEAGDGQQEQTAQAVAPEQAADSYPLTQPDVWSETDPAIDPALPSAAPSAAEPRSDSNLRIAAQRFDRIIAMASDNLVQSQALIGLHGSMQRVLRRMDLALQGAQSAAENTDAVPPWALAEIDATRGALESLLLEMDHGVHRYQREASQLHREVLKARLRPFADILPALRRLVRDTAEELGKQVRLEVTGERTEVDRDILERLRAPLEHLLRNALDHGLEATEERRRAGKPDAGRLRLRARHENGRLAITLEEDGRGIDPLRVRATAVRQGLVKPEVAERLSDGETLEFLFLPGFSTRTAVTEISGRGFGLDIVQSIVQASGGSVRIDSKPGQGTAIHLTLPVTRSVARVMLVTSDRQTYAMPLNRISRVDHIEVAADAEGLLFIQSGDARVPVVPLAEALGGGTDPLQPGTAYVLFLLDDSGREAPIAIAVDQLVGETTVVVRQLDRRLGKLPAVAAVTLSGNDVPMLILEPGDVVRAGLTASRRRPQGASANRQAASVLVVDDSETVRHMLRRTLTRARYQVLMASHGAEAWSLLQREHVDLLVSDVDMPEMNGIELVELTRASGRLSHLPIILLSYKGREQDRRRGLEAGADAYVSKGEFEESRFLQTVVDFIGPAEA